MKHLLASSALLIILIGLEAIDIVDDYLAHRRALLCNNLLLQAPQRYANLLVEDLQLATAQLDARKLVNFLASTKCQSILTEGMLTEAIKSVDSNVYSKPKHLGTAVPVPAELQDYVRSDLKLKMRDGKTVQYGEVLKLLVDEYDKFIDGKPIEDEDAKRIQVLIDLTVWRRYESGDKSIWNKKKTLGAVAGTFIIAGIAVWVYLTQRNATTMEHTHCHTPTTDSHVAMWIFGITSVVLIALIAAIVIVWFTYSWWYASRSARSPRHESSPNAATPTGAYAKCKKVEKETITTVEVILDHEVEHQLGDQDQHQKTASVLTETALKLSTGDGSPKNKTNSSSSSTKRSGGGQNEGKGKVVAKTSMDSQVGPKLSKGLVKSAAKAKK